MVQLSLIQKNTTSWRLCEALRQQSLLLSLSQLLGVCVGVCVCVSECVCQREERGVGPVSLYKMLTSTLSARPV